MMTTRQARDHLREIHRYIVYELHAPGAAKNTIAAIKSWNTVTGSYAFQKTPYSGATLARQKPAHHYWRS